MLPDGERSEYSSLRARVATAIALDTESPSVEFKAGEPWDSIKIRVIRAVLAMSNLRDGGLIIIGHPEKPDEYPEGVRADSLLTYDPDVMRDQFDSYASPRAVVSIAKFVIGDHTYVAIDISEFEEVPVICKADSKPCLTLRAGTVYVRPFTQRPRSVPVASAEEMRPILELAIDKGIALFEVRAHRRGFTRSPKDAEMYAAEGQEII